MLAKDYPYKGTEQTCKFDPKKIVGSLSGPFNITEKDEN